MRYQKIGLQKLYKKITRANSETPGFQGYISAKNLKKKTHYYVYGAFRLEQCIEVAKWRLSSLNFRSQKCVLIENGKRPPQTKFQLPNMFGSQEIKSPRIAYHLYRSYLLNEISHPPIQMIGDFRGFYFSRTKHVRKLKFGLWGSFAIFNQYKFF
jgi:hypothetical protein